MNIQNALQKFYQSLIIRSFTKATLSKYKYVMDYYFRYTQIEYVSGITNENLRNFLFYGRTERNWQTSTFLVFYNCLRVFTKWCVKEQYLLINSMDGIEKPTLEKKLPAKFTKHEAFRFLEIVENYPYTSKFQQYRNHAMFSMYIFAGLRLSELLNLKYSDVDLESLTLFIRQGKGSKDRIVPIIPKLSEILQRYLVARKRANKTCPEFFASSRLNRGFTKDGMKHLVEIIKKASNMKFSIHKLRHTFATLMIEGGCDIYSLSKMMGHSDIKTTTIYLAASAEHLRSQIVKHPLNDHTGNFSLPTC